VWTGLLRAGYDHYRDGLSTPAFLEVLPKVEDLSGLDLGCGEGHNTRVEAGFVLERFGVAYPSDEAVRERSGWQDAQVVAYFLHVRARRPVITRS
jgi:hypothetical protein